jgi:hypothetical protein
MAGFNRKAPPLANRDSLPQLPNDPRFGGRPFHRLGIVLAVTADDATSRYGFFSIPSGCIIKSCSVSNDALGAATAVSFGLFETTQNGGGFALVNAGGVANANQFFGAAVAVATAAYKASLLPVAAWQTVAKSAQPVWQILGLAADPVRDYDVIGSVTAPITAGGNIMIEVEYKY